MGSRALTRFGLAQHPHHQRLHSRSDGDAPMLRSSVLEVKI